MDPTKLAYLAGAIDSDGTIGVKKSTYAIRVTGDSKQAAYSERLALRQVTPQIPKMLKAHFGGALYLTKSSVPRGRPLWSWQVTDIKAFTAACAFLPYLRVKRHQALNLLRLRTLKNTSKAWRVRRGRKHAGSSARQARHTRAMEACYQRAKLLNRAGA